ncbi:MAG: hypothetical protein LBR20_01840 [Propionibacteriaceae bacterium]|jgi:hypothetical protein|nr:hypothetical protein [Propionibacteriaceae bacterium]
MSSPNTQRAVKLLTAGLVGGHLGTLVCVVVFALLGGAKGLLCSLIPAFTVIVFFTIGHGVLVMVADADPKVVLFASLSSYLGRVALLAIALELTLSNESFRAQLDIPALVITTFLVANAWLAAEFWRYRRLRIPVYDSQE